MAKRKHKARPDKIISWVGRSSCRIYGNRTGAEFTMQDGKTYLLTRKQTADAIRGIRKNIREYYKRREREVFGVPC